MKLKKEESKPLKVNLRSVINFGKHKGKTINNILISDVGYIEWAIDKRIIKLRFFAKLKYNKLHKPYQRIRSEWSRLKYLAKEAGWLDDGNGNCGFVDDSDERFD